MDSDLRPDPELMAHERTYHAFNIVLRWCMVAAAASTFGLTLWFATPAGFLGGVVSGLVIFLIGYFGLVRREVHQPLDPWRMH
jgi:hypothetical protein